VSPSLSDLPVRKVAKYGSIQWGRELLGLQRSGPELKRWSRPSIRPPNFCFRDSRVRLGFVLCTPEVLPGA